MVIYRCDRCTKDYENKTDLVRVEFYSEVFNDTAGVNCYCHSSVYSTETHEVCKNCAAILKASFIKCMEEN